MLPQDADMLLSIINMKLRDFYGSLDALCEDLDEDKEQITEDTFRDRIYLRWREESVYCRIAVRLSCSLCAQKENKRLRERPQQKENKRLRKQQCI